jgi:superfamily II DNA/RNA helicase
VKFSELNLHPLLLANLEKIGFIECTQIQEQAIPWIRKGKDVAGLAQTGTGKTAAFMLPLIDRLLKSMKPESVVAESESQPFVEWKRRQYILVLVPTRELAEQVQENAQKLLEGTGLGSVAIYGGTGYDKQIAALKQGVEFVIATPGRFLDLFKEHVADLGLVRGIVFDEADRMFDMGFKDDMKFILRRAPRDRQFMVFSATLNFDVLNVAYEFGADPVEVNISRDQAKAENVKDYIYHLGQEDKPQVLLSLLRKYEPKQAIIFSNFKHNVERISRFLNKNKVPSVGISSLLTQGQRNRVMAQFKAENDRNILVATDVAARGLDILGVDLVINFELPDDPENYVHRIGRTGRAGATGQAFSLVSDRDVDALQRIEDYLKHKVEALWLDDSELVKEFEPLPRDEDRFKKPGGPRRPGRSTEGRGAGGRSGGDRDRNRDRNRDRDRDRDRNRGPRHDRPPKQGGEPAVAVEPRHRDRHTGRHRDQNAASRAGGNSQESRSGRGSEQRRDGPRPHGPSQEQRGGRGASGGNRRHDSRRDHGRPRAGGHSKGGGQRSTVPMTTAAGKGGIGGKVTGFFKKLFGVKT